MQQQGISRNWILCFLTGIMFLILLSRLFWLQIIKGEDYAENYKLKIKRELPLTGIRGNIYDRNGKPLARNKLAYSVTFEDKVEYNSERTRQLDLNGKLYKIITIVKKHGGSVESSLHIRVNKYGDYEFTETGFSLDRFKADVYGKRQIEDMEEAERNARPEDIIAYLADRFCMDSQNGDPYTAGEKESHGLPVEWEKEDLLAVVNMRYALSLQVYQKYIPILVARDVSAEAATAILENQPELRGADIKDDSIRIYEGGAACAPIIGYTGKISSEELSVKEGKEYALNSVVGKSGMEQYLDETLQGEEGQKEVLIDNIGRILQDTGTVKEPGSGKDVFLSIDSELQNKIYDILEHRIAGILLEHLIPAKTFDVSDIRDTTEIKIPVYDVYIALMNNGVIDTGHFQKEDSSQLEKNISQLYMARKHAVIQEIQNIMEGVSINGGEELEDYQRFIVDELDMIDEEKYKHGMEFHEKWKKGNITLREYMYGLISKNCLNLTVLDAENTYLKQEEIYRSAISYITGQLLKNTEFDKLIYKYMILNDTITPEQVCMLLYEQNFLDTQEEDFVRWQQGSLSTYELILEKIRKLEITPADLALNPCSGSAVVTNTVSGKVLACVSYPGYDNNRLSNQIDTEYYYKLCHNRSLPLYNRTTQQLSAPGSTFKPITVIAGLEEKVIGFYTAINCDGVFDKTAPPLKCWNPTGHGIVENAAAALQNSCNDYLCEISYRLGQTEYGSFYDEQALEVIRSYAALFDLDKESGIELAESPPKVTDCYAIPSAIGQGTNNFSTVQLGRYATTLANGGTSFRLSLIEKIDGIPIDPKIESTIEISQETWDAVHTGMEWYIQHTDIFAGCPISAAGKSGTAQEVSTKPDHGLFIGYAPAKDPEIAVAVRIINGYTADCAVECGKEIFSVYF